MLPAGAEPHLDITQAPLLAQVKDWGTFIAANSPVPSPHLPTGGSSPSLLAGSWWDEERNGLWYTYGDSYAPIMCHTTLFFYHLNDETGVGTYYGPWRIGGPPNNVRGSLMPDPPVSFQPTSGRHPIGVMASQASGAASSPLAATCTRSRCPIRSRIRPTSNHERDPVDHQAHGADARSDHRQARSTSYKILQLEGNVTTAALGSTHYARRAALGRAGPREWR